MINIARQVILVSVLGFIAGCVTSAEQPAAGQDEIVVAGNAGAEAGGDESAGESDAPEIVMQETAVVGTAKSGSKVYCRSRAPTGSRLPARKCMTEEQRQQQAELGKGVLKNRDRRGGRPVVEPRPRIRR